jgi:hypothetical protein
MRRKQSGHSSQFKDTQVYDWDAEPKDERPSEFVPSTGYSQLSGYYSTPEVTGYRRRKRGVSVITASVVAIGLGLALMIVLLHYFRGG